MKIIYFFIFSLLLSVSSLSSQKLTADSASTSGINSSKATLVAINSSHPQLNNLANFGKNNLLNQQLEYEEKNFLRASWELGVVEFIPWAMARWIRKWDDPSDNWARVGFNSWRSNIEKGWEYDGDAFLTNYFAHPYHGNLYYNVGRTNGYDFWESSIWAFSGSLLWEYFGETYRPSFNDWINTSLNGISLGEITYKLSTLVTDNTATGSERVWQEVAGFLINPVRGFNRLISGESGKVFENPTWRKPDNLSLELSSGVRRIDRGGKEIIKSGVDEGLFEFDLTYANYSDEAIKTPFSSFNINAAISTQSPNLTRLHAVGNLYGWKLGKSKNVTHTLVTSLAYSYYNNPGFVFGNTSITPQYILNWQTSENNRFVSRAGINFVAMGGTPNDYYEDIEGRNYDFGPGLGNLINLQYGSNEWYYIDLTYYGQWLWTQSEPSDSKHHLHFLWLDLQYPLNSYFAVGLGAGNFWRESYYENFDNVFFKNPIIKFFFKTKIF